MSASPGVPEATGLVERFHDYLERSWLPGRGLASPAGLNAQLAGWLATVNTRWRRHLGCAPADRIGAGRAAMIALPPVAPVTGGGGRPGCRGITTSGWTATTIALTRR